MRNLTLSLFSVVLIASIGFGWMFDTLYNQYDDTSKIAENEQKDNITVLEQLGLQLASTLNSVDNRQQFIAQWPEQGNYTLALTDLKNLHFPDDLIKQLKNKQVVILESEDSLELHFYLPKSNELLILSAPPIYAQLNEQSTTRFIFTSLFYLAVLSIMLVWLTPLARRLLALRKSAKAFGEGDLNQRVEVGSIAYISDLEIEFNHMAQRIEGLVNDVKLLSSAVSHDLRTPLARIRFGIDTLQEEEDPELRKRFEQRISDNVDEMVELVETLLSYARLDQKMLSIDKKHVDFSAIVTNAITHKTEDNIQYDLQIPSNVMVFGDPSYLMILVSNLIQNANQYCLSQVKITLEKNEQVVILTVSDNGQGIALQERYNILQPFIRGEHPANAMKNKPKGYGMGLAIVKRVLEWHEGKLHIGESASLQGAEFSIELPRQKKH